MIFNAKVLGLKDVNNIAIDVNNLDKFTIQTIIENIYVNYNIDPTRIHIVNKGKTPLKLYTLYSPPEHKPNLVQKNRPDDSDDE